MNKGLGPGSRFLLVAAGFALIYVAIGRGGWLPKQLPAPWPPEPVLTTPVGRPASQGPLGPADFAWAPEAPAADACVGPLRIAVVERAAVVRLDAVRDDAGVPLLELVPTPRADDALKALSLGDVQGAVVSVSELVTAWPMVAKARGRPAILATVAGTSSDLALAAPDEIPNVESLAGRSLAVVPGSAEELVALATLARAGVVDRVTLVPAASPADAVARLERGEVAAAAAPQQRVQPLILRGVAINLPVASPLDPLVLVDGGRSGCLARSPVRAVLAQPPADEVLAAGLGPDARLARLFGDEKLGFHQPLSLTRFTSDEAEVRAAFAAAVRVRARQGRLDPSEVPEPLFVRLPEGASPGPGRAAGAATPATGGASAPAMRPPGPATGAAAGPTPTTAAGAKPEAARIEPVAPVSGRLQVEAHPAPATIVVDGVPRGPSPWSGEISPGEHRVGASSGDGSRQRTRTVRIEPGQTLSVTIELGVVEGRAPNGGPVR